MPNDQRSFVGRIQIKDILLALVRDCELRVLEFYQTVAILALGH